MPNQQESELTKHTFALWAGGDAHVGTDLERGNRRSLAEAILQAENGGDEGGPSFDWDIMLDIGDLSDRRPLQMTRKVEKS